VYGTLVLDPVSFEFLKAECVHDISDHHGIPAMSNAGRAWCRQLKMQIAPWH
jgi:hypothetical protein